jgi:predicted enzyme related to lactoylglutathione lyase
MNIRHTGIYVQNIEEMVSFYKRMFKLEIVVRQIEEGTYIDTVFGEKDTRIDVCKLKFKNGGMIELIKHMTDEGNLKKDDKLYSLGKMHIAITVDSADEMYKKFIGEGCNALSKPCVSSDGKAKVFFTQDIEGNYLEIVEEIIHG